MVKYYTPPGLNDVPYAVRPFTRGPYTHPIIRPEETHKDNSYPDYVLDYNDPYEINSIADAFFNRAAMERLFPRKHNDGKETWHDLFAPVIQTPQALWYLFNKSALRPLGRTTDGKWTPDFRALGLNTLTNFSESMDVLANPIKGLVLEREGRNFLGYSGKGFMRGLGADTQTGRKNYDWDIQTGGGKLIDGIANMAMEILSDPFNWVTLGGKAVVQSIVNSGADALAEAAQVAARSVGKELSDEGAQRLAKQAMKQLVRTPDAIHTAAHGAVQRVATKGWVRPAVELASDIEFSRAFVKEMANLGADRLGINAIRSVQQFINASEGLEKVFLHASTGGVLKGAGWAFKRGALNPLLGFYDSHIRKATKQFVRTDGTIPLNKMEDALRNIEDAIRYKAADTQQGAEYVAEQIKLMQIFSIEKDVQGVVEAIQKTSLPKMKMDTLNQYFFKITEGELDFKGYLDLLDEMAKKYPHLEAKYVSLRAIFDTVDSALKIETARGLDKKLSELRRSLSEAMTYTKGIIKSPIGTSNITSSQLRLLARKINAALVDIRSSGAPKQAAALAADINTLDLAQPLPKILDDLADALDAFKADTPRRLADTQTYVGRLQQGIEADFRSIWTAQPGKKASPVKVAQMQLLQDKLSKIDWQRMMDETAEGANFRLRTIRALHKYTPADPTILRAFPAIFPGAKRNPELAVDGLDSVFESIRRKQKEIAAAHRLAQNADRLLINNSNRGLAILDEAHLRIEQIQQAHTAKLAEQLQRQTKFAEGGAKAITQLQEAIMKNPGVSLDDLVTKLDVQNQIAATFPKVNTRSIQETLDLLDKEILAPLQEMGRAAERLVYTDWYVDNLEDIYKRLQDTLNMDDKVFAGTVLQELSNALEGIAEVFNDIGADKNINIFFANQPALARKFGALQDVRWQHLDLEDLTEQLSKARATGDADKIKELTEAFIDVRGKTINKIQAQVADLQVRMQRIREVIHRNGQLPQGHKDLLRAQQIADLEFEYNMYGAEMEEYQRWQNIMAASDDVPATKAMLEADLLEITPHGYTDSFGTLLESIETMQTHLSNLDLFQVGKPLSGYIDDAIRYQLKLSQAQTALILLNDPQLLAFTDDILTFGETGKALQNFAQIPEYRDMAMNIQSFAYEYVTYGTLLKNIMEDQTLGPIRYNLFDTLQNYKQMDLNYIATYRSYYISKITDKLQSQMSSLQSKKKYGLDWLFKKGDAPYQEAYAEWLKDRGLAEGKAHTAAGDSMRVQFLIENDPSFKTFRDSMDHENKLYILMDTETTGTEIGRDRLTQIAWHDYMRPGQQFNIDIMVPNNVYPSEYVLNKMGTTVEEFRNRYMKDTLPTEYEALNDFFARIKQMENDTGKSVILIAHNGEGFDFPMLEARIHSSRGIIEYPTFKYFQNLEKVDTLIEMHKADGMVYLTLEQRKAIKRYLETYIEAKTNNPYKHVTEQQFIKTADGSLAKELQEMADILDEMSMGTTKLTMVDMSLALDLRQISRTIWDNMSTISQVNSALRNAQLTYDPDTGVILGADGKALAMAGGILQPMQLFATDIGQLMPGALRTNWRSSRPVQRFFKNVKQMGEVFTDKDKLQLFLFSRTSANISDKVKRLDLAALYYDRYAEFTKELQAELTRWYGKTILIPPKYIELFDHNLLGTADRYAAAYQLYFVARSMAEKNGFDRELTALITRMSKNPDMEEAIKTLRRRELMYQYDMSRPAQELFDTGPFDLNATELYKSNEAFRADIAYKAMEIRELQEPLALLKNKHGLDYAMTQMQASVIDTFKQNWDVLQNYIERNPDMIPHLQRNMIEWGNRTALSELDWVARLPDEDLKEYLWGLAQGRLTFGTPYKVSTEYATYMDRIYKMFMDRKEQLAQSGIMIHYKPNAGRMYIYLKNDPAYVRKMIDFDLEWRRWNYNNPTLPQKDPYRKFYIDHEPAFRDGLDMDQSVFNAMENSKQALNDLSHGKVQGTLGDMLYLSALEDIDEAFPAEIRKMLIPIADFKDAAHFDSTIVFNRTNIGLIGSRREIMPKISSIPFKNYMNAAQQLVPIMDGRIKAKYLFFDEANLLRGSLYKELSNEELFEMLQRSPQLRLAALVEDSKLGAKVQQFHAGSAKQLGILRDTYSELALLPSGTLLQAYKNINTFHISNSFLKFLKNYVVLPAKLGYLTSVGFLFRNIVDSTLKNFAITDNPAQAPKMIMHMLETSKQFRAYTEIYKELINYTDDVIKKKSEFFSLRTLDRMYAVNPNRGISKEMFQMIHNFLEHGPSAGLTAAQVQTMITKNKHYRELLKLPEEFDLAYELLEGRHSKILPFKYILNANSAFEQVVRLSAYTWELMNGSTIDEAMDKILRTHFDYSMKPKWMMYMEYVIPFASFFVNNTAYWMEVLDTQPWIASFAADMFRPVWNRDEYSHREINENRSLQYNILAGNMIIDHDVTLKLNPSMLDAVRALIDPEETINRVIPYVRIPVDTIFKLAQGEELRYNIPKMITTNLPLIGPIIQKAWVAPKDETWDYGTVQTIYERTGQIFPMALPSIFGAVLRQYYFAYPGTDMVYMTKSKEKFQNNLEKGAVEIRGAFQHLADAYVRRIFARKTFRVQAKRYYAPKKQRRTYQKKPRKLWVPKAYAKTYYAPHMDLYAGARVLATVRNTQFRMPNQNRIMMSVKPALVRRLYTGSGQIRFKNRLVPVTAKNLAAKLKADWSNLR